ncbi:MAG: hypothetical protein OXH52_05790 [Gammaproteobacteria bacterium]|nr:hypothetical protein [Gammaproteobacteria bacterium]
MEVLGINHGVVGLVAATFSLAGGHKPRKDWIAEFGNDNQVIHSPARCLGANSRVVSPDEVGLPPVLILGDSMNLPY